MKEIDFKELWQSQQTEPVIDAATLAVKAKSVKRNAMYKIIFGNTLLLVTLGIIVWAVAYAEPKMLTTKIGSLLIIIGLIMQIIASSKLIPLLKKNDTALSNSQFLQQLLVLKKKQTFLETTIMSLYFLFLVIGLGLFMIEYALKMTRFFGLFYYTLTALWMAFAWFYLRPKTIKKQRQQLDDLIKQIENLEKQLGDN